MTEKLLTVADLAALIGVAQKTIRHGGADTRHLPKVRLGREVRYRPADVERWLLERRHVPRRISTSPRDTYLSLKSAVR